MRGGSHLFCPIQSRHCSPLTELATSYHAIFWREEETYPVSLASLAARHWPVLTSDQVADLPTGNTLNAAPCRVFPLRRETNAREERSEDEESKTIARWGALSSRSVGGSIATKRQAAIASRSTRRGVYDNKTFRIRFAIPGYTCRVPPLPPPPSPSLPRPARRVASERASERRWRLLYPVGTSPVFAFTNPWIRASRRSPPSGHCVYTTSNNVELSSLCEAGCLTARYRRIATIRGSFQGHPWRKYKPEQVECKRRVTRNIYEKYF